MFKNFNYILFSLLLITLTHNTYGFDLKSLTDKIQKDLGNKLQTPKGNNNSNPLGGMLKGLNKNNINSGAIGSNISTANSSNNQNAKRVDVSEPVACRESFSRKRNADKN